MSENEVIRFRLGWSTLKLEMYNFWKMIKFDVPIIILCNTGASLADHLLERTLFFNNHIF